MLEWRAFSRLEPFGSAAEDYRFGKLLSVEHGGSPLQYFPPNDAEEAAEVQQQLNAEEIKSRMMRAFVIETDE